MMRVSEWLLPEFDLEMAYTRKHLERVPDDRFGWKPHGKSMSLGWLATFLGVLPTWGVDAIERDSFDVARPGGVPPRRDEARSRAEVLERFDRNAAALRAAIAAASDDHLAKPWSLLAGGKVI